MFLTIHATVGAAIGASTNNAFLAFLGGFLSHFIFDAIPHGDGKLIKSHAGPTRAEVSYILKIALLDALILLMVLGALVIYGRIPASWPVVFGASGAMAPDFLNAFYYLKKNKWLKPLSELHLRAHHFFTPYDFRLKTGVIFQAAIEISLLILIFIY